MRKILHITGGLDRNGTETFIMNVYRHIDRKLLQFDFLLFTQSTEGYYSEAESMGAKIYRLPTRRQGLINYCKSLYAFFRSHASEYEGIHFSACSLTTIYPIICAKIFHIPIRIVHAHSTSWEGIHNYILHHINRIIIPFVATDFLACSSEAAKWFYPFYIRKHSVIIKNGIDAEKYAYNPRIRAEVRSELGIEDSFVIGHVGRFSWVKNHELLLKLIQAILPLVHNAKLVLVGDGELRKNIENQIQEMGLNSHILILGYRTDIERLMQAFDCFVLPSHYEALPFVLLEAQCSGLKILASDVVSFEAKVTDNIYFINLHQSIDDWVKILQHFVHYDRQDKTAEIVLKGYSTSVMINDLMQLYMK